MLKKLLIFGVLVLSLGFGLILSIPKTKVIETTIPVFNPFPYVAPQIPLKRAYLTLLVGDSMTEALGANANGLRLNLIKHYPNHEFVNYNYGYGSTNILSLEKRINSETTHNGAKLPSIISQGFDLIIIESFAYNPLSEYSLEEGLKKYEEELNKNIKQIIKEKPESMVVLMTPLAPNKENYAKFTYNLSPEVRLSWVKEREAYIQKIIEYANKNNIPLINVYEKSLDENHNGNLKYIDPHDFIHPSKDGVKLIEETIADFIYKNNIFPQ